jgi:anti-sigma factor RsiW
MKCGNIREQLMEAVLSGPELATPAVQEHLATCSVCAQEVASLRQAMSLLDEWQAPEPSPYFSARVRARLRDERSVQSQSWFAWMRRPAVMTAAAALLAVGVGLLEGAHWKTDHQRATGNNSTAAVGLVTTSAVTDLQYLDSNADLFSDFDALDDNQTETN